MKNPKNKFLKWDSNPFLAIVAIIVSVFVMVRLTTACNETPQVQGIGPASLSTFYLFFFGQKKRE